MTPRQVQILVGLGVLVAVLGVVLVVVLVIGWGDPEAAPTSLPTTTGTESTTTTTWPATTTLGPATSSTSTSTTTSTTSTSTTTTTLPAGACGGPGAGPMETGGSFSVRLTFGDFDGDGEEDRFVLYEDGGGAFRARVELSYGYAAEAADPVPGEGLTDALAVNLGGAADLALAVTVGHASEGEAAFLRLHDCELEVVRTSDDREASFPVGSNWVGYAGVTCQTDGITVTAATPMGGGDWQVSSVSYRWDPAAGVLGAEMGAAAVLHSPEDDTAIESHGDFNC